MAIRADPEGTQQRVLFDLADFAGKRVLEIGCGDGRMTWLYAGDAAETYAIDTNRTSIGEARSAMPRELRGRVRFAVADIVNEDPPSPPYDLALLSWSL